MAKGVDFITQKYEKDQHEKDAIIATLQYELKSANLKVKDPVKKMDKNSTPGEIVM